LTVKKGKSGLAIDYLDDKIKDYVKYVSESSDTFTIDKKVDQNKVVLSEGQDGYELDRDKTFSEIKKALESDKNEETITLSYKNVPRKEVVVQSYDVNKGTLGLYPGRYIEVNLSQQIMYLIEGNNQIGSYTVSTGAWDTPTPIGTLTINSKDAMAWSSKYGLYMPYWNDIGGGYGIHELPEWPGGYKEGEAHLGIPVSHGCIRLGVGSAEFVYNWASIGTPVVIHN
jgi:lipoprotein-anchoring transpeptidase ErfK/SrfK